MKKLLITLLISLLLIPSLVYAEEDITPNAKNSILVEVTTGKILYEKEKDTPVAVASLTKMMAQILILEEVENKRLSWDEEVKVSSNAASYGGTQIYLEPGEVMTVRDLMKGISMASANDATIALAERIAGTEDKFVEMMNKKAKELGLKNTNFINPTGLDYDNHYSSAYDMALIGIELLKHPVIFEFSSLYEDYLRQDTPNKFWLVNTNKLIRTYEGCDGLKTGFTDKAGYTMAVTAKRDNMRLLAIVLGEDVSKVRNKETTDLLDYGFNTYKVDLLKEKGDVIDSIKVNNGKDEIKAILNTDIITLLKKNENKKDYKEKITLSNIKLPIKKNDNVGKLELYEKGTLIGKYNLVSNKTIKKKNIFKTYLDNIKDMITGNFTL